VAERLRGGAAKKGFSEGGGTFAAENILQGGAKNVSESDRPVCIEAAGNNASVTKNAYLITKAVAGVIRAEIFSPYIGPIKFFAPFQE